MTQSIQHRLIGVPRIVSITFKSWQTDAPMSMLMNNLGPVLAENPKELIV